MPSGEASDWAVHDSADGRKYYYNSKTGKSTWEKPECLKDDKEKMNTTQWKEFKTSDGRTYFYNGITKQSVWTEPEEVKKAREAREANGDIPMEAEPDSYDTREEKRDAFWRMLTQNGFTHRSSWAEVSKKPSVISDKRFNLFPTGGERKQIFTEFQTMDKKRQKDKEREKRQEATNALTAVLKDRSKTGILKANYSLMDFFKDCGEEDWWSNIDDNDRDDAFQDFMEDWHRKDRDDRRSGRKECARDMRRFLDEHDKIDFTTKWREAQVLMQDEEFVQKLDKIDLLEEFERFVEDNQRDERDNFKIKAYRKQRVERDDFIELLQARKKDINFDTPWPQFCEIVKEDPRYLAYDFLYVILFLKCYD